MHTKIFIVFLLATLSVKAQKSTLEYNGDIGFFNTSINEELLSQSYGVLDSQEKKNIIDALKTENKLAFEAHNSLKYSNKKGWSIGLSNRIGSYATYPKSLIELSLLGNAPFKGDTLSLDPLHLTAFHYSQVDFSYQWSKSIQTTVGLLLGHQLLSLDVNNAKFYTESNGESIDYYLDYEAHFSDTSDLTNNLFRNNGHGAVFGISYKDSLRKGTVELSLSDIGFIKWNKKTSNLYIESEYNFDGISVDDFVQFNDSIITNEIDSVRNILQKNINESYIWRLPSRVKLAIQQPVSSSLIQAYTLTINHKMYLYQHPRVSLDLHKIVNKHHFTLGYHVGGYENPGFQFSYLYKGDKTHFQLYTKQANAINPTTNYGIHIGIGIKRVFSSSK